MPAAIKWTPEIETQIEDAILAGETIGSVLKTIGISEPSFYRRRLADEAFERTIARAQEIAQEREVEAMTALADTATEENYNAIKLQIWTRMWIAGKRKPKKYGDKQQLEHSGEVSVALADRLKEARQNAERARE